MSTVSVPSIRLQVNGFDKLRPDYQRLADFLEAKLEEAARELGILAIVQARVKTLPSFAEKAIRKRTEYSDPVNQFPDLCGARIITETTDQVHLFCDWIRKKFRIEEGGSEDVMGRLRPSEFGYLSVHFVAFLKEGALPDTPPDLLKPYGGPPPELVGHRFRSEIQVRTLLQHTWAAVMHDSIYKAGFEVPSRWHREAGKIAALLEDADEAFVRLREGVGRYQAQYGVYMDPERIQEEIDILETVHACDTENAELACRIAGLYMELPGREDHQRALRVLGPFKDVQDARVQLKIGQVKRKLGDDTALENLEKAEELHPEDVETLCELARTWWDEDDNKAHDYYCRAFNVAPADPCALGGYLESRICRGRSCEFIASMRPILETAIETCRDAASVGVNLPCALYYVGRFSLFIDRQQESLEAYIKAIDRSPTEAPVDEELQSILKAQRAVGNQCADLEVVRRLLAAGKVAKLLAIGHRATQRSEDAEIEARQAREALGEFEAQADADPGEVEEARRKVAEAHTAVISATEEAEQAAAKAERERTGLARLATEGADPIQEPVIIVAGGCDERYADQIEEFRRLLETTFESFEGTIISGGTTAGISGIVGDLKGPRDGAIRKIGYLPRLIPTDVHLHTAYEIRTTAGEDFSEFQPSQYWIDLLSCGVDPVNVKLIGVNGGRVSGYEFRLALALGATVGILRDSGRAATRFAEDPDWLDALRLARLPSDAQSVKAFVQLGSPSSFAPDVREQMARTTHDNYRRDQRGRFTPLDPAMANWENLREDLKKSNRQAIDNIEHKLNAVGYKIRRVEDREIELVTFTEEEVERMAEMEHGRWNVERLIGAWLPGEKRDPTKKRSPYLVPWADLDGEVKKWDYSGVRQIPELLKQCGYEIYRESTDATE